MLYLASIGLLLPGVCIAIDNILVSLTQYIAEKEFTNNEKGYCVKFKFAFQWCESQGLPWWLHDQTSE